MTGKWGPGESEGSIMRRQRERGRNLGTRALSPGLPYIMRMKDPTNMMMAWRVSV